MSDYTPTTDEVRDGWVDLRAGSIEQVPLAQAEFDRFLAQHDAEVKAAAWDAGWHAGYIDRHRERVDDDGFVIRNPQTPNPYDDGERIVKRATLLRLYIVYEASGSILLVTSDRAAAKDAASTPGDHIGFQQVFIEEAS